MEISDAEKACRRREVDEVRHSSAMEGAQSTPAFQERQEAYVRGEIEVDDLVEAARRLSQVSPRGAASLTDEERAARRRVVDRARHSTEMEGGRSSEAARVHQEAWVRGEINAEELVEVTLRMDWEMTP